MKSVIALAVLGAHAARAQRSASDVAPDQTSSAAIASWRTGLEVSVNGSVWDRSVIVGLSKTQCPPSPTSPCEPGSAVAVDVRFPPVTQATDLSKVRAQLGEPPSAAGNRYEIRLVRERSSPLCAAGFATSSAYGNARMAINVGAPGPPLPLTCRWTAVVGIPASGNSSRVAIVWSDTVVVQLTSKP
jgi:hypothetical protein